MVGVLVFAVCAGVMCVEYSTAAPKLLNRLINEVIRNNVTKTLA